MKERVDSSGGLTWARTYEDETGLVDTQQVTKTGTSTTFEWIDLGYDKAGNVTSRMEKLWRLGTTSPPDTTAGDTGTGTWTYGYDGAGRMLTASGPGPTGATKNYTYTYDGQGNRTQMVDGGTTWTWTTDNQGWPTQADKSTTGANPDVVYTFDPDGDLTSADDQVSNPQDLTFGYDSWGLTTSATAGSTSLTYTLDPLGRTASRTVGGATTTYAYGGSGEDLATSTLSNTTTKYAYGPAGPLSTKVGSGTASLYIPDVHGDVVATIASGASSLTDTAWYSPYGERTTLSGSATQMGYQGDYTDAATGAVDMTTRWYLPGLGRFSTRDVLGGDPHDPPSLNQFVYVGGSPVTMSDMMGMCANSDCPPVINDGDPLFVSSSWQEPEGQANATDWIFRSATEQSKVVPASVVDAIQRQIQNSAAFQSANDADCRNAALCKRSRINSAVVGMDPGLAHVIFGRDWTSVLPQAGQGIQCSSSLDCVAATARTACGSQPVRYLRAFTYIPFSPSSPSFVWTGPWSLTLVGQRQFGDVVGVAGRGSRPPAGSGVFKALRYLGIGATIADGGCLLMGA